MASHHRDLPRDVARRIRQIRIAREITLEEFAHALPCERQYVVHLESGTANLTLDSLKKIAAVLGVDAIELLAAPGPEPPRPRRGRRPKPK